MSTVHSFNLGIYPRKIWVMISPSIEEVNKLFSTIGNKDVLISENAIASTLHLQRKSNNHVGELIILYNLEEVTVGVMAHEATHAAINICNDLGINISVENQEPIAYLTQYITDFINKVVQKENDRQRSTSKGSNK